MESFEQLAAQYTPMIHKIIRSLNIYTNKEEFFQLGLIGLWEAQQRFDPEKGKYFNYAYTYIKGKLQTEMKKNNLINERNTTAQAEFWEYIPDEGGLCPLEKEMLVAYCQSAGLTENQEKWILYTCMVSLSIKEIAELEGVSVSAVKQWRSGAKEKIRKMVDENILF